MGREKSFQVEPPDGSSVFVGCVLRWDGAIDIERVVYYSMSMDGAETSQSLSGGFSPSRLLRPSSGRELKCSQN